MKGSPRFPCTAATSTAPPAPTAAWPETPTVPGMAAPAPGSILQEKGEQHETREDGFHSVMKKWDVIPFMSMYKQFPP